MRSRREPVGAGERSAGLYSMLGIHWVYSGFVSALGADRVSGYLVDRILGETSGLRILDFGAGTGGLRSRLGDCDYTAIEPNPGYCRRMEVVLRPGDTIICGSVEELEALDGTFDRILMMAVLHHLNDELGERVLRAFARHLAPDGMVVVMDNVFSPGQSTVSRLVAAADRGQHVRTVSAYQRLARRSFAEVKSTVTRGLLRVPYDHHWMVCRHPLGGR